MAPKVVKPVDAAGLVLIRAARNGAPEILLGRRHRKAGFLPDIYVVPGGRVDAADHAPSGFAEPLHPAVAASLVSGGTRRPALAFPRAALRETHEETGLLVGLAGAPISVPTVPVWKTYGAAGIAPDFAGIDFICRAITPVTSHRRYNTRFFLGDGNQASGSLGSNGELEDLGWRSVAALSDLNIVDVTEYVLKEALRRWQARVEGGRPAGMEPPKLLNYRNDIMTLSRHRSRK